MCGIAGFINSKISGDRHHGIIRDMLQRISYRGPDEMSYFLGPQSAFGSVRLSIIDVENGQQPIFDESERYALVFNGELYNYLELRQELKNLGFAFKTASDTEVALSSWLAWGNRSFEKFNGSYAMAIFDRSSQQCTLARDRFGKRPLFYVQSGETTLFASEMKCFLSYPTIQFSWDTSSLSSIFRLWTPLPYQTAFTNIYQVPPGSYLTISEGKINTFKYYELNFSRKRFIGDEADAAFELRNLLEQSVRLRMRSDVKIGTYLSGGIDSSITTLIASELSSSPVRTFSVEFEQDEFNESREQRQVSSHLGTEHRSVIATNKTIAEDFSTCIWHAETPIFRTAVVPLYALSKHVKESGIKVALTGEGADEIFLGYDIFKETHLRLRWRALSEEQKKIEISKIYPFVSHYSGENLRTILALYDRSSKSQENLLFSHIMRFQNNQLASRLLANNDLLPLKKIESYFEKKTGFSALDPMNKAQFIEFETLLSGYLLSSQGDRMSLANGVENRCPFLDHNVVEFAASLPQNLKLNLNGHNEKHILKKAYKHMLPADVIKRPKRPYQAPDISPFCGASRPHYINEMLDPARFSEVGVLNTEFCSRLVAKILKHEDSKKISPRESQAFVFLLSLMILDSQFIRNENEPYRDKQATNLTAWFDGRETRILKKHLN